MNRHKIITALIACACGLFTFCEVAGFAKYVPISVSGYSGAALSDFPVLIKIDASSIPGVYSDVKHSGADLKFTDDSGEGEYPYEVDTWNPSGTSYVWVKLPSFASGVNFRMYYGDNAKTTNPSVADVWTGYKGVWHLNTGLADSVAGGAPAVAVSPTQVAAGAIGSGCRISSEGVTSGSKTGAVYCPSTASVDYSPGFTVSVWMNNISYSSTWDDQMILATCSGVWEKKGGFCIRANTWPNSGKELMFSNSNCNQKFQNANSSVPPLWDNNVWHLFSMVWDGSLMRVYIDGVAGDSWSGELTKSGEPLTFGNCSNLDSKKIGTTESSAFSWKGGVDECRFTTAIKSADWLRAEYLVATTANLLTFGDPQSMLDPHKNRVIDVSATEQVAVFCEPGFYKWTPPMNASGFRLLVVGGGGAGGGTNGGAGGGGGQVIYSESVPIALGKSYSCVVGAGGTQAGGRGNNGGESSFSGWGIDKVVAIGGGGGGGNWAAAPGGDGANGGGGGGGEDGVLGGNPTVPGGFPGGKSSKNGNYYGAGGGGGAGGPGVDGATTASSNKGGDGGPGLVYGITGENVMYGAGGGGTVFYTSESSIGRGGSGDGYGDSFLSKKVPGQPGNDGTGGGGGGGETNGGSVSTAGRGGHGTVIIRYVVESLPTSGVTVNVSKQSDAKEQGLVAGGFTFTCSEAAKSVNYPVRYTVSGTAKSGQTYEELSGIVVIPAGQTSVVLPIKPLSDRVIDYNSTVTVTITPDASYTVGFNPSATLTIVNDSASTDPKVRYIATGGNDANDGLSPTTAFASLNKALSVLGADGGTVYVMPGEYVETAATISAATASDANGLWYSYYQVVNPVKIVGVGSRPEDAVFKWAAMTSPSPAPGGASRIFYINHPKAKLKNLTVRGGRSGVPNGPARRQDCGGSNILIDTEGGTVEDCLIDDGKMETWGVGGGGIQMHGGRVIRCRITNCIQGGQYAQYAPDTGYNIGSAVYMTGGVVENTLMTGNGIQYSGCTVMVRGTGKLFNCTIAGNKGLQCAGVAVQSANGEVRNCAIFNNTCASDSSGFGHVLGGKVGGSTSLDQIASVFFNCAADAFVNEDCIQAADGGFVDQSAGDYHLGASSCCRDAAAGYSSCDVESATDLDGLPRKMGVREDIGCYEFDTSVLSVDFVADVTEGLVLGGGVGFRVNFTALVEGEYSGDLTYEWDLDGDGTPDKTVVGNNKLSYSYQTFGSEGYFNVSLTISVGSQSASASKTNYIHVGPPDIYVDSASSGGEFPYNSADKAAPDLFTALKAALTGSTIHMAAGEYVWNGASSTRPDVNVGVRILGGTSDPKDTVVRYNKSSNKSNSMLLKVNHPDAFIANITWQDGFVYNDGANMPACGIHITGNGGTVSNCVIKGCSASETSNGAAVGGVRMEGGMLTHCILDDNRMYNVDAANCYSGNANSRKAQALYATGPSRIENCLFRNMHTDNCLIVLGVDSKNEEAVMRNCTVVNCSFNFWTDNPGSNPYRMQWPCSAIECILGRGKVYNTVISSVKRRGWHHNNSGVDYPEEIYAYFTRNSRYPSMDGGTTSADLDTDARCCTKCATDGVVPINSSCVLMTADDFVNYTAGDLTPKAGGALHDGGNPIAGWSAITDLAGARRVVDDLDIGCYEQQSGGPVRRYYVDCLFTGESTGRKEAPFKTIKEGCAAATQVASEVYVRGGPDRHYVLADYRDSVTVGADSNKVYGCDVDWNPATGFVETNSMANLVIADDYAHQSFTLTGGTGWQPPVKVTASECTISGFYSRFGCQSYKQQNEGGGEGLISLKGGISGTTIENCWFEMKDEISKFAAVGACGVVSGADPGNNIVALSVQKTCIRKCYFWMAKFRASVHLLWNLHHGTRFEENLVCHLDTLYEGGGNLNSVDYHIVSNIFLNCSNGSNQASGGEFYVGWLLKSVGNGKPASGEIAYNRFIHNADDGISTRYRLFQHGAVYNGSWNTDTYIHHNTIVGYDIAFESPLNGTSTGRPWSPNFFDNIIVSDAVFSEDAVDQWTENSIKYKSSFMPGSMFMNNAVLADNFVIGTATAKEWYDIGENLEGTNTTEYLDGMPAFVNTSDPLNENYYRLRVPSAPWVINAWVGDDPTSPEFPRYIGAVAPQPGGFAVRIR